LIAAQSETVLSKGRRAKGEEQRAKSKGQRAKGEEQSLCSLLFALCPLLLAVSLFVESQIKLPLTTLKTYDNHQSPF
jgi:hypothetical protein